MQVIKAQGGLALVQDPADALYDGMPRNAIESVAVDWVEPLAGIAARLVQLIHEPVPERREREHLNDTPSFDADIAAFVMEAIEDDDGRPGDPSVFSCPDCGGVLWERHEDEVLRFRCRVGHAFSSSTLLAYRGIQLRQRCGAPCARWRSVARCWSG